MVPVMQSVGERYERIGDCVDVEHLFTQVVNAALVTVMTRRRRWSGSRPILLMCPDEEHHTLAEARCPSRVLGASVPVAALRSAVRRIGPRALFVWAQHPDVARLSDLGAVPRRRPPVGIVVGGPGWLGQELPNGVTRVDTLAAAVDHLCR